MGERREGGSKAREGNGGNESDGGMSGGSEKEEEVEGEESQG